MAGNNKRIALDNWALISMALIVLLACSVDDVLGRCHHRRSGHDGRHGRDRSSIRDATLDQSDPAKLKQFEQWQKSPIFVAPYETHIKYLPDEHLSYIRATTRSDFKLFRELVEEAIKTRKNFAAPARLLLAYATKMITMLVDDYHKEQQLKNRYQQKPSYYTDTAALTKEVAVKSALRVREKGYTASNVNVEDYKRRLMAMLDYVEKIVNNSPYGNYCKWREVKLYSDDPKSKKYQVNFIDECIDILAIHRAMGYDGTMFVADRLVEILNLFGDGKTPPNYRNAAKFWLDQDTEDPDE